MQYIKVDVDENDEAAMMARIEVRQLYAICDMQSFNSPGICCYVQVVPTVKLYVRGEEVDSMPGPSPAFLTKQLAEFAKSE